MASGIKSISIVIPFYNEEGNLYAAYESIKDTVNSLSLNYEIIFVDDGSIDKTYKYMKEIAERDRRLKIVKLLFNCGQTAAMQAGFDIAQNEVIIPMDGDLQNDPSDIPRLLEKIEEGYDVVSGWRRDRKDNFFSRTLPSKIANKIISFFGKVPLHDYGCSLKAYRKDILDHVSLYGEMHRFIPIYASRVGAKVTEIPVRHHPRTVGSSKYGISRSIKVILDLITIMFFGKYATKPNHFFGMLGLGTFFISFISIFYVIYNQTVYGKSIIESPIFHFAIMCFLLGCQFILMGLLGEVLIRTYHESQKKKPYTISNTINLSRVQREDL